VKYLLVLLVVGFGLWLLVKRLRGGGLQRRTPADPVKPAAPDTPAAMVQCAHCGLHLPAADAVVDGSRPYCSDAHRLLGPVSPPP
jgi:uncharacterized protein